VPRNWPRSTATLHDLMPLARPDVFVTDPHERAWFLGKAEQMKRMDALLAVSASSAREAVEHLGFDPARAPVIGAAADEQFHPLQVPVADRRRLLGRYGIRRPFVMFTGGDSPQKNIGTLVQAYARLPHEVRRAHQLVLACKIGDPARLRVEREARACGLGDGEYVVTGYVPDAALAAFYNLCRLFVFPSWHEGFGLPVLEAMQCGAPVLAARATSLPEVVGWEDALFDPHDAGALSTLIARGLGDADFAGALRRHGRERAREFSWERTAERAWDAFEALVGPQRKAALPPSRASAAMAAPRTGEPGRDAPATGGSPAAASLLPVLEFGQACGPEGCPCLHDLLGTGWCEVESWGVWSRGRRCTLFLNAPAGGTGPGELWLRLRGFVGLRHPGVRVDFQANGRPAGRALLAWVLGFRTVRIPLGCPDGDGCWRVECTIRHPRSPASLGLGRDERELGIGLARLELRPGRPPASLLAPLASSALRLPGAAGRWAARQPWTEPARSGLRRRARLRAGKPPCSPGIQAGAFSIILCTLDRAQELEETLHALQRLDYSDCEVVVVEGPCRDGTAALLDRWAGRIKRVPCPQASLSIARNLGLAASAGEWTAFLDDDARPEPGWLDELAAAFADPEVGAAGGKVLDPSGLAYQYEYASSDRLGRSTWKLASSCPERNYPGSYWFPYLQGTNCAFRRAVLEEAGGFDEAFAYYLDETEACLRVNDAGWAIRQLDGACVIHHSASSGIRQGSILQDHTAIVASKLYFAGRHGPLRHSAEEIAEENERFIQDHRHGVKLWVEQGLAAPARLEAFERQVQDARARAAAALARPAALWRPCPSGPPPFLRM